MCTTTIPQSTAERDSAAAPPPPLPLPSTSKNVLSARAAPSPPHEAAVLPPLNARMTLCMLGRRGARTGLGRGAAYPGSIAAATIPGARVIDLTRLLGIVMIV